MTAAYFHHAGADLFYVVEGPAAGFPVLLLHGWTCDHLDWSWQQPFLQALGFRTVALDHRGHGRSSSSAAPSSSSSSNDSGSGSYGPKALAADAAALLAHLGIAHALVVGHSMGTLVASALAVRHAPLVRALVLLDPVYHVPGAVLDPFVAAFAATGRGDPAPAAFAAGFIEANFYTAATPAWLRAWHRHRTLGCADAVVRAVMKELNGREGSLGRRENAVPYMKGRRCPRFVACAEEAKVEVEREIGLDEAVDRVVLIEAGHWLHQQEAEMLHGMLEQWFRARGFLE